MTTSEQIDRSVETARQTAAAYVWGWQDASGQHDTGYSLEFAAAYAEARRAFDSGERCWFPNLASAFQTWKTNGTV